MILKDNDLESYFNGKYKDFWSYKFSSDKSKKLLSKKKLKPYIKMDKKSYVIWWHLNWKIWISSI